LTTRLPQTEWAMAPPWRVLALGFDRESCCAEDVELALGEGLLVELATLGRGVMG
jgi:hypothetical protein